MVGACSHQVSTISAEGAVPDPALMAMQSGLEWEGVGVAIVGAREIVLQCDIVRLGGVKRPDTSRVICAAGGKMPDIRGEQHASDVGLVGEKGADGDERGDLGALDHAPDVDFALETVSKLRRSMKVEHERGASTLLLPAQSMEPSLATVTLATETSASGMSWCEHLFSPKSQMRTFPPRSQLISSPWFGWMTTSLTGTPWV